MISQSKAYAYKKGLRIATYAASLVAVSAVFGRIIANIQRGPNYATVAVVALLLTIPFIALVTVNTQFVVTDDSLTKRSLLGVRTVKWTDVIDIVEKEGNFQQLLILVDKGGRKMTLPYEQIADGKELYAKIKQIIRKSP